MFPSQSLHQTHDPPALCYSIPKLNVASQLSDHTHSLALGQFCTEAPAFLTEPYEEGRLQEEGGIPPEETGSCGSGSIGSYTGRERLQAERAFPPLKAHVGGFELRDYWAELEPNSLSADSHRAQFGEEHQAERDQTVSRGRADMFEGGKTKHQEEEKENEDRFLHLTQFMTR
ncbi:hypothetical protein NQZ68_024549 [Dissostichus eleginoides]|nr:hypothetical protein NQZ68_024549 [Dissostichus eleginoides]